MSIDYAYTPCALCAEPVMTDDTDRVRYDEDDLIGVSGPMHVGCYTEALVEAVRQVAGEDVAA